MYNHATRGNEAVGMTGYIKGEDEWIKIDSLHENYSNVKKNQQWHYHTFIK